MKLSHYLKKVHQSQQYRKFKEKHKKAYFCAGFFVLDPETGKDIHQIDYMLPNNKIATFLLDNGVKVKISEQAIKKKLPEIKKEVKTDISALKGIVQDEMKNRTVTANIKKMIAVLHVLDDKLVWNLQCILDGLNILLIHIDDSDQTILKFEKHSLMELIKQGPTLQMMPKGKEKQGKGLTEKQMKKLQEQLKGIKEKAKEEKEKAGEKEEKK